MYVAMAVLFVTYYIAVSDHSVMLMQCIVSKCLFIVNIICCQSLKL